MKELAQYARHLFGVSLSPGQVKAFEIYERELIEWNSRMNLTAIDQSPEIRTKHFLDSLSILCLMQDKPMDRVIDVGTGAGFPGLPLKIAQPSIQLTLVDSVGKKVEFCRHIVNTLSLEGVQVIQERAELLGQLPEHREKYDWALARAVAIMPVLAEYLLPLVKVGGRMVAMKGESGPAEAQEAQRALHLLGGGLTKVRKVELPGVADERYLILVQKQAATPKKYPRQIGRPSKKPL